ncbi:MAG TPA: hypothetical protein VHR66_04615 [Gemmataceae bacterium]|nr:hypothetical protein [Gemmataceae bacterium]
MSTEVVIIDDLIEQRSLVEESWLEACKERWIRSQKAGCDQGEKAIREWVKEHWRGFLRARWIQHMQGDCFWLELKRDSFGLLKRREFVNAGKLLDEIIEQLRCGEENLDILRKARKTKTPAEQATILEILLLIDVNANRLRCSFCDD